ncbi:M14 family metallopeptidase [Methylomarinum vadi]|uniref:M14 family metallopeptidase n=1 Tax=Methylomarinum vadi TaxID=438855 RepID=UPI0004DED5A6|nr:M14 family metallopeptidase [Methylomarinum vadi]
MSRLRQLDYLPEGILTASAKSLWKIVPEPTLIHLQGQQRDPLFISVLLHGNEPTGLLALQELLKKYKDSPLPRSLSIFLGNTQAAKHGLRRLQRQPDFNRVWPGTEMEECEETRVMREIVDVMKHRRVFASVDVHNNTGLNPHYACINKLDNRYLQLASLFGHLIVYFTRPKGVQSMAFAELCPAVTLECGRPGQQHGIEHAFDFLNTCLHLQEISDHPIAERNIDLFHTVAQVKTREEIEFSFEQQDCDLLLDKDLEKMNFTELAPGTLFGTVNHNGQMPVIAQDEQGNIVTEHFFEINNNELLMKRRTMPSMLTLDERVIRQDCLCYLMERLSI